MTSAELLDQLAEAIAERVADRVAQRLRDQAPKPRASEQAQFLDEKAVAARFGISRRTLQGWRGKGTGPAWCRANRRVLYPISSFEEFLNGRGRRARASINHQGDGITMSNST